MIRATGVGLRRGSLATVLLVLLQLVSVLAAPAFAGATPTVTSFSPTSGPVGTNVVITGTNFTGANRVEFNGTDATFTVNSATQITAAVPTGATDGPIAVTVPGGGTGTSSTNFDVTPAVTPTVSSFSPTSGPIGQSVVITGTNFNGATSVRFNGTAATTYTVNSNTQITATVPSAATDGPISVVSSAGTGTSAASFDVTPSGPPTISGFTPSSGAPGTSVVITGTNFTGATAVRFAGTNATTYTVNGPTQITATVPTGAGTGAISVVTSAGTGTSSSSFTVTPSGPTITSFTPSSGPKGTSVQINGTNFTGATAVTFNGATATFTVNNSGRITATVPTNASTGKIVVTTPNGSATSATDFTVTPSAPSITSFTPTNGPVGSSVTITGADFSGTVTVKFNGVNAAFTVNSSTQITTTVPTGATTGRITIANANGTGTSATDFIVTQVPTITTFTPATGPVGSSVQINGTNFTGISAVRFNGVAATYTVNSATRITATVPAGATTGKIQVQNSAGTATSATDFTVAPIPQIAYFTPPSGPVGTYVTITGQNFDNATAVNFNSITASFSVDSDTQITAIVPTGAADGVITVTSPTGTGTSNQSFVVQDIHARTVSLSLSGHLAVAGQVSAVDNFAGCEVDVAVKIQRRVNGTWNTIRVVNTGADGLFSTELRDRKGYYRARAVKLEDTQDLCRRATSPIRRHRHN
ncbi:MAG: hypothetical protein QOG04_2240 [Actinomycetota bacterium]|jgi:hypothetical protein|nr:hypothetical protein [Actinomycetota bacterium]